MFVFYLDSLLEGLHSLGVDTIVGYADDVAVVVDAEKLAVTWNYMENWAAERFMKVGYKKDGTKTAFMVVNSASCSKDQTFMAQAELSRLINNMNHSRVESEKLVTVKAYKYLGCTISTDNVV